MELMMASFTGARRARNPEGLRGQKEQSCVAITSGEKAAKKENCVRKVSGFFQGIQRSRVLDKEGEQKKSRGSPGISPMGNVCGTGKTPKGEVK